MILCLVHFYQYKKLQKCWIPQPNCYISGILQLWQTENRIISFFQSKKITIMTAGALTDGRACTWLHVRDYMTTTTTCSHAIVHHVSQHLFSNRHNFQIQLVHYVTGKIQPSGILAHLYDNQKKLYTIKNRLGTKVNNYSRVLQEKAPWPEKHVQHDYYKWLRYFSLFLMKKRSITMSTTQCYFLSVVTFDIWYKWKTIFNNSCY